MYPLIVLSISCAFVLLQGASGIQEGNPVASAPTDSTDELHAISAEEQELKTLVSEVYPTASTLPENLLRFYVYFKKPMQTEDPLQFLRLVDDEGEEVVGAFLENKFQLWSPDRKRLTVLFDPGRVKTGLVANQTLGRALQPNHNYELIVLEGMPALDGCKSEQRFQKRFSVGEVDLESPNVDLWKIESPESSTREPLIVRLNGPHDHVSLAYRIRVCDESGEVLKWRIKLGKDEESWIFVPQDAWTDQRYRIRVSSMLEDLAGNRLGGLFESPDSERANRESALVFLSFHPRTK